MTDADAAAYPGGITSSDKRSSGLGVARIVCESDLRIARRRRQIDMTKQNLNDSEVGSAFQEVRREAMAQGVQRDSLGQPGGFDRRSAGGVQHRRINGMIVIPTGKQEGRRPRQPPVGAKNAKQLRRQHRIAVLASFAMPNQDHAPRAVDVRHSQPGDFRGPESRRIGRG
jgi:hypothetical protein